MNFNGNRFHHGIVAALILSALIVILATIGLAKCVRAADIVFTIPTTSADTLGTCGASIPTPARVKCVQVQRRELGAWRMLQFWCVSAAGSRDGRQVRIRTAFADTALIRARTADSLGYISGRWSCWVEARRPRVAAVKDLRVVEQ